MFIYLTKCYVLNNVVAAVEIVEFSTTADLQFKVYNSKDYNLLKQKIEQDNMSADFTITNDLQIQVNHDVRIIKIHSKQAVPSTSTLHHVNMLSFYDLLRYLVDVNAVYLEDDILDCKLNMPSFSTVRISQSTMSVTISVCKDNLWYSKNLINVQDDGKLSQQPFYCFIPAPIDAEKIKSLGLVNLHPVVLNNVKGIVAKYKGSLPICSSDSSNFCEPLITHYCHLDYIYSHVCRMINRCSKALSPKTSTVSQEQDYRNVTCKLGVFYSKDAKKLSNLQIDKLIASVNNVIHELKRIPTPRELRSEIIAKGHKTVVEVILAEIYRSAFSNNVYDILLNLENLYKIYSAKKLDVEMFLYNSRVCCVFNPDTLDINYPHFNKFYVQGSVYNSSAIVLKRRRVV